MRSLPIRVAPVETALVEIPGGNRSCCLACQGCLVQHLGEAVGGRRSWDCLPLFTFDSSAVFRDYGGSVLAGSNCYVAAKRIAAVRGDIDRFLGLKDYLLSEA